MILLVLVGCDEVCLMYEKRFIKVYVYNGYINGEFVLVFDIKYIFFLL